MKINRLCLSQRGWRQERVHGVSLISWIVSLCPLFRPFSTCFLAFPVSNHPFSLRDLSLSFTSLSPCMMSSTQSFQPTSTQKTAHHYMITNTFIGTRRLIYITGLYDYILSDKLFHLVLDCWIVLAGERVCARVILNSSKSFFKTYSDNIVLYMGAKPLKVYTLTLGGGVGGGRGSEIKSKEETKKRKLLGNREKEDKWQSLFLPLAVSSQ